jgi:DNA mismatch repair protein MutS
MTDSIPLSAQVDRTLLTPMMKQYIEVKQKYPHTLVLYRLGDFYEAFFEDAHLISRELELVLTGKEAGKEVGRVPMAGIPYHALERYAAQLVEKGISIAICDQVETAAEAQGSLVRREVTRVITPGTVMEEGMLAAKRNNFLVAIASAGENWGLAYADISTGEFLTTQIHGIEPLAQELLRLQPAEILIPLNAPNPLDIPKSGIPPELPSHFCYTPRSQTPFLFPEAKQRLLEIFRVKSLEGMGCEALPLAIRAAGGLLEYLASTQKNTEVPLQHLSTYTITDYLILDHQTRRNLEITQTARDSTLTGSLLWALDQTSMAMGSRALRRWLLQPLKDLQKISDRADTIQELLQNHSLRQDLRAQLREIYDIERLCSRIGTGTANARDLQALAISLSKLKDIAQLLQKAKSVYLVALQTVAPAIAELGDLLQQTLQDSLPISVTEGKLIRAGINPQLDQLQQQAVDDAQWLLELEKTERERTGISTLKVSYNKTFGYYISISRGKSDQAPSDYIRKQTLSNEERYITPELKEKEARIANAQTELHNLEYQLFTELRDRAAQHVVACRAIASALSAADALASLAELAATYNYVRPVITDDRKIDIRNGRHPVVEKSLPSGFFVPNSIDLGSQDHPDLIVLTGPNMSGKSTFLRQLGLIQLMAQVGSFVPADAATLGLCDRIFTRVGAVDDLAMGQSTFMVEMLETANILNHARTNSLVLLDEIGRGTSTFDGMAIAWSVAEYLATKIKARAIFATHYHELNELAGLLENVANFQVTVKELADEIIFLHQVQPGGADRSYGIEVGRLAGLPPTVINRAKELLLQIDRHSHIATGLRRSGKEEKP